MFGALHDPNGEFFIKQQHQLMNESNASMNVSKLDSSAASASGNKSIHHSRHGSRGAATKQKTHEKSYVDYAAVPSHFPVAVTDRIRYIGESVWVLSRSESKSTNSRLSSHKSG